MAVLFIDENYFRKKSPASKNVDYEFIVPIIEKVQDLQIQPLLGTDLYEQIKTQIDTSTLSSANSTLLNTYLAKIIVCYTTARLAPVLKYRLAQKGVVENNGENSQPTDDVNVYRLADENNNDGDAYADEMIKYITTNSTSYPAYFTNNELYKKQPRTDGFDCGWYLPDVY